MYRRIVLLVLICVLGVRGGENAKAQDNIKLAQSGMQFLSVVSDARGTAMAGAVTALPMQSASLFFNPAAMAQTEAFLNVNASYNMWIADINHSQFSLALRPWNGDYGVIGFSAQIVNYGEVLGTRVANTPLGYEDTGVIKPTATAFGIGYAKSLSEAFSIGAHVKWVRQSLGQSLVPSGEGEAMTRNKAEVIGFDFGTLFRTGLKSLAFGMSVRNFSQELKFQEETFPLPLTFTIGISMDAMDLVGDRDIVNSVLVSVDAIHHRDYREQLYVGAECFLMNTLALRGGYVTGSDEAGATMGVGVTQLGIAADFSYTPFGAFDKVQRFTLRFSL